MRLISAGRICLLASSLYTHITGATAAAAAAEAQIAPTPATAFATTKTRIWSTTASSVSVVLWLNSRRVTSYTTATMTAYEPGPVTGPFPATVTQTVVSHVTWQDYTTYINSNSVDSSRSEFTFTTGQTWIVSPPAPTDLAVGTQAGCFAESKGQACAEVQPDGACEALGLKTACLGQCERRDDGNWWCYRMWQREYGTPGMTMGRACWGGDLQFRQLNVPCVEGDVGVACARCKGVDQTWGAVNWSGPG